MNKEQSQKVKRKAPLLILNLLEPNFQPLRTLGTAWYPDMIAGFDNSVLLKNALF
jgi:hypothetical protein